MDLSSQNDKMAVLTGVFGPVLEHLLKDATGIALFGGRKSKWRQKAKDISLGAIDKEPLFAAGIYKGGPGNGEFHTDHEP